MLSLATLLWWKRKVKCKLSKTSKLSDTAVLTNVVTEIFTHKGAQVDYKIQNDREEASLVDSTYIHQEKHCMPKCIPFRLGANLFATICIFIIKTKPFNPR